jgi:hypothetical protein
MLIVIWRRYVTGSRWWLVVLASVLLADILIAVFIGDRLIRWEIDYIKESW